MEFVALEKACGDSGLLILIYGRSGKGKTFSCRNLPWNRVWYVTNEPRGLTPLQHHGITCEHIVVTKTPGDFYSAVERAVTSTACDILVLDTLTSYYDMLFDGYVEEHKIPADKISFSIYQWCMRAFVHMFMRIMDCAYAGKHVIMLCHEKSEKEEGPSHTIYHYVPDLPGQLPEKILRKVNIVLRAIKLQQGGEFKYLFSMPDGNSYGKDWTFTVKTPMNNDVNLLLGGVPPKPSPNHDSRCLSVTQEQATDQETPADAPTPPKSASQVTISKQPSGLVEGENPEQQINQDELRYLQSLCNETGNGTGLLKELIREHFGLKSFKKIKVKHMDTLTRELTKLIDKKDEETVFDQT